jgi:group I intron endonuclease
MLKKNSNNIILGREQDFSEFNKDNNNPKLENDINNIDKDKNYSEQYEEGDVFVQKTIDNNNLIYIENKHEFNQENILTNLKSPFVSPIYNLLKDKNIILKEYKNMSGVYLLHNNVNGKQYIGSGFDLSKRFATYYFPSRLTDNRYISNSILKYGHGNFSVVILSIVGNTNLSKKIDLINEEQIYINLYKPILNLNPTAGSSLGFKHSEESKKLISEFRTGKSLSEKTKKRLSELFSGELNPFWSKTHSSSTLEKMSKSKLGFFNPMYNKEKSKEFIDNMYKDKKGSNNPMFGKTKSEETLTKLRKKVYVYNEETKELLNCYPSMKHTVKDLHIANETINKYIDTNKSYKGMFFYTSPWNKGIK